MIENRQQAPTIPSGRNSKFLETMEYIIFVVVFLESGIFCRSFSDHY